MLTQKCTHPTTNSPTASKAETDHIFQRNHPSQWLFRELLDFPVFNSQFMKGIILIIHQKLWWMDLFTNINHLTSFLSFWLYQYFRRRKIRRNEDKTTRQGYLATTGLCNLSSTKSLFISRGRNKYSFFQFDKLWVSWKMFPSPNWMVPFNHLGIQGVSKKVPFRANNDPKPESS